MITLRSIVFITLCVSMMSIAYGQTAELIVETGLTNSFPAIVYSPDGTLIAGIDGGNTVKIFDAASGQVLRSLVGHEKGTVSAEFSRDGKLLAVGSNDKTASVWDIETGKIVGFSGELLSGVNAVHFSRDAKTFFTFTEEGGISEWNFRTGDELRSFAKDIDPLSVAFSSDGRRAAIAGPRNVELWDLVRGTRTWLLTTSDMITALAFSPDGKTIVAAGYNKGLMMLSGTDGHMAGTLPRLPDYANSVAFSHNGELLAVGTKDGSVSIRSLRGRRIAAQPTADGTGVRCVAFSPVANSLAFATAGRMVKIVDASTGKPIRELVSHIDPVAWLAAPLDLKTLAAVSSGGHIKLWNTGSGDPLMTLNTSGGLPPVAFSKDGKMLASGGDDGSITIWDSQTGDRKVHLEASHNGYLRSVAFSVDAARVAAGSHDGTVTVWDVASSTEILSVHGGWETSHVGFSSDGSLVGAVFSDGLSLWEIASGRDLIDHQTSYSVGYDKLMADVPDLMGPDSSTPVDQHQFWPRAFQIEIGPDDEMLLFKKTGSELIARLFLLDKQDWVVTTPDGRFDTSKSLDDIQGLHWVVNNEILKPLPLDVFMRQYYEPGLLQRALTCNDRNDCAQEFKPLPAIAEIDRVQPKVAIREIKPAAARNAAAADLADVTVEVDSVAEDVAVSAADRTKKQRFVSGGFDLRLFLDGQLVGDSTPREKQEAYIADAPRLVDETKASGKLTDTPEDKAWRSANDVFDLKDGNVDRISPDKIRYTFHDIKLPKDGRKEVEFTAYAFNSDRVKSATSSIRYRLPESITSLPPRRGRAFVVSIGVNASEDPLYDLQYAANDARNMQSIIGERLKAETDKYSEVIQVPLISDRDKNGSVVEDSARKAIIKGVFSLLAGNEKEVPPDILKQIPNRERIKPIEPDDTLIVTYAGHGYADHAGIFYLLPSDIGKETTQLTPSVLKKMISSDELSLWMQDITATEMIMIIDACHSSAAVQGDGFKPGPMGSRGLGQLAYDKGIKILAATQADNVALELDSLQQGLLSYALLQDGIKNEFADADHDKRLTSDEWLSYAEKRVPELYQEIKDGKRDVVINGRDTRDANGRAAIVNRSSDKLQQPALFDFRKRNDKATLFVLQ